MHNPPVPKLSNKKILITAGPTREWMDPVRFLSNPSSGEMGIVLADVLRKAGASVTLVLGPTHLKPSGKVIHVTTAIQMHRAVMRHARACDAFIATAAVGDWRFKKVSATKLKKKTASTMTVTLVKNPDILKEVGELKGRRLVVGFSLETNNVIANAKKKLRAKDLDLIIANQPASFSSRSLRAAWIERSGKMRQWPTMTKTELSEKISAWLAQQWNKTI